MILRSERAREHSVPASIFEMGQKNNKNDSYEGYIYSFIVNLLSTAPLHEHSIVCLHLTKKVVPVTEKLAPPLMNTNRVH